jgi:hypothetical protein
VYELSQDLIKSAQSGEPVAWQFLNDTAFMAFGVGAVEQYDQLSALALAEDEQAISLATRALYLAGQGHFDQALKLIDRVSAADNDSGDIWIMYSPAFLVSGASHPAADDFVDTDQVAVEALYRAVISAVSEGESAAAAIEALKPETGSSLLVGAACAEAEGNAAWAQALRARAADLL